MHQRAIHKSVSATFALLCTAMVSSWADAGLPAEKSAVQPTNSALPTAENDAATSAESTEEGFVGNNFSLKFHCLNCPYAEVMWKKRRVRFKTREEAVTAKMAPCRYCLPTAWTSVRGAILLRTSGNAWSSPSPAECSASPVTLPH